MELTAIEKHRETWPNKSDEWLFERLNNELKSKVDEIHRLLDENELQAKKIALLENLPNGINMELVRMLFSYSDVFQISVHLEKELVSVYIKKNDVELNDFGGDFNFAFQNSIDYLERITKKVTNGKK